MSLLPHEVLIQILEYLVPSPPPLILPPHHISVKTLLSLTRVSRAVHETAIRLLYTYCVYIDQPWRMHKLCLALLLQEGIESTHLTGLPLWVDHDLGISEAGANEPDAFLEKIPPLEQEGLKAHYLPARPYTLSRLRPHKFIKSIYLQLLDDPKLTNDLQPYQITDQDLSVMHSLSNTLTLIHLTLRHLIININTSSNPSGCDMNRRRSINLSLRISLFSLRGLETCCSVRDECYFNSTQQLGLPRVHYPPVWHNYKNLCILVLTEAYWLSNWFWRIAVRLPHLRTVVLIEPIDAHLFNLQGCWKKACEAEGIGERELNIYVKFLDLEECIQLADTVTMSRKNSPGWHHEKVSIKLTYDTHGLFLEDCLDGNFLNAWSNATVLTGEHLGQDIGT